MSTRPPIEGAFDLYRNGRSTRRTQSTSQVRPRPPAGRRGSPAGGRSSTLRSTARRTSAAVPPSARSVKHRMVVLLSVVVVVFSAVVVKLVDVQVLHPDAYVSQGERQRLVSRVIPAGRGSILDRNGVELALSLPRKTIFADPKLVQDSGDEAKIAREVALALGLDHDRVLREVTGDGRFAILAHTVSDSVAKRIADLKLPGISSFDEFERLRPSGDVAQSLLGKVSTDGTSGTSGLERQFDRVLNGEAGSITYERSGQSNGTSARERGLTIAGGRQRVVAAKPGKTIELTIDRSMQYQTEQVLAEYVAAAGANGGVAIITKPETGEILTMANVEVADGGDRGDPKAVRPSRENSALSTAFEPGSVTKVVTIAAAMDAGIVTPDTPIDVPDHLQIYDHEFTDAEPHASVIWTPTDILVSSSNIGTIKIAQQLGKDRIDAAMRRFGLGSRSGLNFPSESTGIMLDPDKWSGTSIGAIPIGQGIAVTALQMLDAFNVIANDGVFVAPRLVGAVVGTDGQPVAKPAAARRRVVSADTATKLRAIMAKVVSDKGGTGTKAAIPGYTVAGKTGTARKPVADHMKGDGYKDKQGRYHYVATFAGFVPAEKPELSVIVVLDEPTRSIYASDVSAPAFSDIARYALRRYQIPPGVVDGRDSGVPALSDSARGLGNYQVPGDPKAIKPKAVKPKAVKPAGSSRGKP